MSVPTDVLFFIGLLIMSAILCVCFFFWWKFCMFCLAVIHRADSVGAKIICVTLLAVTTYCVTAFILDTVASPHSQYYIVENRYHVKDCKYVQNIDEEHCISEEFPFMLTFRFRKKPCKLRIKEEYFDYAKYRVLYWIGVIIVMLGYYAVRRPFKDINK